MLDGPDPADPHEPAAVSRRSAGGVAALLIGIAVLLVGLAVSLDILLGDDDTSDAATRSGGAVEASAGDAPSPTTTVDPRVLLPLRTTTTEPGATTSTPLPAPSSPAVGGGAADGGGGPARSLLPVPVVEGASGGRSSVPTVPPPTTGTVRVRLFNGVLAGVPLDVWDVAADPPTRYGTVGYGELAEIVVGGRLLPGGVELRLRFVRPGGDPTAPSDPSNGPWQWNLTPANGSSQTLAVVPNPGFRVVRIDNLRALRDTAAGRAHVVPVVFHLVLDGTRRHPWAAADGCLGPASTDDVELDLAPGALLRLADADDPACNGTAAGPLLLDAPGAYAVVGLDDSDPARLVALPLG